MEADRLQPVELSEMFEGWQWRYSRTAELVVLNAAIVGNRIPLNKEPVGLMEVLKGLPLYTDK